MSAKLEWAPRYIYVAQGRAAAGDAASSMVGAGGDRRGMMSARDAVAGRGTKISRWYDLLPPAPALC